MRDFKSTRAPDASSPWLRLRVRLMGGVFLLLLAGVFARAVNLQIVERAKLREMAEDQYVRQIEIPARRGDIFDRRGVPLAQSVEVDSIWIDPSMLDEVKPAAKKLAAAVHVDPGELLDRLSRGRRFAWVKRQAKPDEVAAVRGLDLPGVGFTKEPRRFYPQRELAAHVIGLVGTDGKGLEGLELAFDQDLSGETALLAGFRDAKGRKLLTQDAVDASDRQGASLTLTLDRQLQYITEKALARAVADAQAPDGMAVMLDPKTGEILAMANEPRFNPNTPQDAARDQVRDRAALDTFEPGSTFKSFVIAAALEEHAVKPDDTFFCENGAWDVGNHTLHDSHPHAWLSPQEILQVSSNIGAAKIAQVLGRDRLVAYYEAFGFGDRTSLGLPGEGHGVVPYPKAEVALCTEAFGQGLTATAVQIAAAYGAIANGGVLMRPYLVSKAVDPDGTVVLENAPTPVRQVVSEKTAHKVISMLESVVEKGGTAPKAHMDAYQVAGKTGTAQKVDPVAHGYSDKRIASFVGIVPAEDPRLVILVVIDEPKIDVYGGDVAAPAFKEIASAALPYLGVSPSRPIEREAPPQPLASAPRKVSSAPDRSASEPAPTDSVTEHVGQGNVKVPDLVGRPAREAVARLLAVALEPRIEGSGRVVSQSPGPGSWVEKGARVRLEMALRP